MNSKEYNEKWGPLFKERNDDFWAVIKDWLERNPERFIVFQTYIPSHNDGDPCYPCIQILGPAPGFVDDYYVDSTGEIHYAEDLFTEIPNLPKKDQEYLKDKEEWSHTDIQTNKPAEDIELEAVLMNGYEDFIQEYDVTGTIKLVDGKPSVETEFYECGY